MEKFKKIKNGNGEVQYLSIRQYKALLEKTETEKVTKKPKLTSSYKGWVLLDDGADFVMKPTVKNKPIEYERLESAPKKQPEKLDPKS